MIRFNPKFCAQALVNLSDDTFEQLLSAVKGLFLDNFNFKKERIIKRTKCNHKCYSISGLSVERFNYLAEFAWEHWHANYTNSI